MLARMRLQRVHRMIATGQFCRVRPRGCVLSASRRDRRTADAMPRQRIGHHPTGLGLLHVAAQGGLDPVTATGLHAPVDAELGCAFYADVRAWCSAPRLAASGIAALALARAAVGVRARAAAACGPGAVVAGLISGP